MLRFNLILVVKKSLSVANHKSFVSQQQFILCQTEPYQTCKYCHSREPCYSVPFHYETRTSIEVNQLLLIHHTDSVAISAGTNPSTFQPIDPYIVFIRSILTANRMINSAQMYFVIISFRF